MDLFELVRLRLTGAAFPIDEFEEALTNGGWLSVENSRVVVDPLLA